MLRSQLDCIDNRLPGTGVFDIKTRAAFPIRHDIMNFKVCCTHGFIEVSLIDHYQMLIYVYRKTRDTKFRLFTVDTLVLIESIMTSFAQPS